MSNIDWNLFHAKKAAELLTIKGTTILVVGANTGKDCRYFMEWGVKEVHGLDVLENTGKDFQAPSVFYHIESAEQMSLPSNTFDLVYCFATMEHIPRIDLAFYEMARVTRPGGFIYCLSAPLWNSWYGHHKEYIFKNEPWIHLLMTRDEILNYCQVNQINAPEGDDISIHINYMLNPANMNQIPAKRYLEVCQTIPEMNIIKNKLAMAPEDTLPQVIFEQLKSRGYTKEELLAGSHIYIGQKKKEHEV